MNRSALPLVRGVYGLVRIGLRSRAVQACRHSLIGRPNRYPRGSARRWCPDWRTSPPPGPGTPRWWPFSRRVAPRCRLAGGVINRHVGLLMAGTTGGAQAPIAGDPVPHLAEPSHLFGVDVDHLAGPLPLVAAHWWSGLQVPETAQAERLERCPHGGEGACSYRAMRRRVQRWCLRSTACCSCFGSSVRRWLRRTLRRSASAAGPPSRNRPSRL